MALKFPTTKRRAAATTEFKAFSPYENGRIRRLKFDVNALADFEEKTGMGFAQLMQQKAIFASARAMLWAGLKFDDRALSIEEVGNLITDYMKDETVERGEHTIDTILMLAIEAAVEQGALGRPEPPAETADPNAPALTEGADPNVLDAKASETP